MDAGKQPPLYKLSDIMDTPIPGYYYREQLTKSSAPKNYEFFHVEKIVKSEIRDDNKLYHLVKYMHYPAKFNRWVAEEDMLK